MVLSELQEQAPAVAVRVTEQGHESPHFVVRDLGKESKAAPESWKSLLSLAWQRASYPCIATGLVAVKTNGCSVGLEEALSRQVPWLSLWIVLEFYHEDSITKARQVLAWGLETVFFSTRLPTLGRG